MYQALQIRRTLRHISEIDGLFSSLPSIDKPNNLVLYYTLCCSIFTLSMFVYTIILVGQAIEEDSLIMKIMLVVAVALPIIFVLLVETQFCAFVFTIYQRFIKVNKTLEDLLKNRKHPLSEYPQFYLHTHHSGVVLRSFSCCYGNSKLNVYRTLLKINYKLNEAAIKLNCTYNVQISSCLIIKFLFILLSVYSAMVSF